MACQKELVREQHHVLVMYLILPCIKIITMTLPLVEAEEFISLHHEVMLFAGQESGNLPQTMTVEELMAMGSGKLIEHRDHLYKDLSVFDRYATVIKGSVPDQWVEDLKGFEHYVRDRFFVMKHYKKYTVLMGNDKLYGVLGLMQPIEEIIPEWALPAMIETVLLPFRGHYVYDGLMATSNINS